MQGLTERGQMGRDPEVGGGETAVAIGHKGRRETREGSEGTGAHPLRPVPSILFMGTPMLAS